jgi:hypothetical protein
VKRVRKLLVALRHTTIYLFLNIIKFNLHIFFVIISLMCVQASPLLHLTKSRLCVVMIKHPECTLPRHSSRILQFHLNARQLSLHCISATLKCVWQHSTDSAAVYIVGKKTNIFRFGPSFMKTPMSEADVTLAWIEILLQKQL